MYIVTEKPTFVVRSRTFDIVQDDYDSTEPGDEIEKLTENKLNCEVAERSTARALQMGLNSAINSRAENGTLTAEQLKLVYNPSLSTVAIDAKHSLAGAELIGMAAARGREKLLNIVYINTSTSGLSYSFDKEGGVHAQVNNVHIIDGQGRVLSGTVPEGIMIDAVETIDLQLLSELNFIGINTLSNPDKLRMYNDKHILPEIGDASGVLVPKRFDLASAAASDDIVIKPSNGSQGRGVYFGSKYQRTPEDWQRYYDYLEQKDYSPLVEERIACWPLYDPKTHARLDWNVRALVSYGEFVDMYVRAGSEASAVNKSTGAKTISMDDLSKYLGDDAAASAQMIRSTLKDAAEAFAASSDDFILGIDLTINDRGEVVMFEANAGHVGGLQTISMICGGSKERRLSGANKMLSGISKHVQKKPQTDVYSSPQRVPLSFNMRVDFLKQTRMLEQKWGTIVDYDDDGVDSYVQLQPLIAKLRDESRYFHGSDVMEKTVEEIMRKPFEASYFLSEIPMIGSQALVMAAEELYAADAHSTDSKITQIYAAAQESDLSIIIERIRSEEDRAVLREAGIVKRRICDAITRDALIKGEQKKDIDELLKVYVTMLTLTGSSNMDATVSNAFFETASEVASVNIVGGILIRTLLLAGKYEMASQYAEQLDIENDEVVDYYIDTLNIHQGLIMKSEAGRSFAAHYLMGVGGRGLFDLYREQGGVLTEEIEKLISEYDTFFEE